MRLSLRPAVKRDAVTNITADELRDRGIRLVILDLDNTVAPYKTEKPTEDVLNWTERMKSEGITLFIVSNNKGTRPEIFSEAMGIPYIKRAGKPSPRGVREAMRIKGAKPEETALVGDQIYTDVIAANLAGVTPILVEPVKFTNVFLRIRYFLELPFRFAKK